MPHTIENLLQIPMLKITGQEYCCPDAEQIRNYDQQYWLDDENCNKYTTSSRNLPVGTI